MFKFTIRELVLVTTVVALALGWWLDRRTWWVDRCAWWAERRTIVTDLEQARTRLVEKDASLQLVERALNAEPYSPLRLVAIRRLVERENARHKPASKRP
jgi:hypothetical protein